MKLRPQEVTNWIKSKKKDVVPSFKLATYGKAFKEWWITMQPSWRTEGGLLICDVPEDETWQMLRKGGTSSIYIVIVGLSWWVKAQLAEQDTDAWTLVNDLSWVLQQMEESLAVLIPCHVPSEHPFNSDLLRHSPALSDILISFLLYFSKSNSDHLSPAFRTSSILTVLRPFRGYCFRLRCVP